MSVKQCWFYGYSCISYWLGDAYNGKVPSLNIKEDVKLSCLASLLSALFGNPTRTWRHKFLLTLKNCSSWKLILSLLWLLWWEMCCLVPYQIYTLHWSRFLEKICKVTSGDRYLWDVIMNEKRNISCYYVKNVISLKGLSGVRLIQNPSILFYFLNVRLLYLYFLSWKLNSCLKLFFVGILMLEGTWLLAYNMEQDALVDIVIYRMWNFTRRKITWRAFSWQKLWGPILPEFLLRVVLDIPKFYLKWFSIHQVDGVTM